MQVVRPKLFDFIFVQAA